MTDESQIIARLRETLARHIPFDFSFCGHCDQAGALAVHLHEFYEIRLVFRANADGATDYNRLRTADITIPYRMHPPLSAVELRHHISFHVKKESISYIRGGNIVGELFSPSLPLLLDKLDMAAAENSAQGSLVLQLLFALVLAECSLVPDSAAANTGARRICNYIHLNYYNPDLTVAEVARAVNYSPNYIQFLMKKEMDTTPREYLVRYRLEKARRLLARQHYQIKEVAALCGWKCPHYFTNTFRKYFGYSPGMAQKYTQSDPGKNGQNF